jgi:hypothetical protein
MTEVLKPAPLNATIRSHLIDTNHCPVLAARVPSISERGSAYLSNYIVQLTGNFMFPKPENGPTGMFKLQHLPAVPQNVALEFGGPELAS